MGAAAVGTYRMLLSRAGLLKRNGKPKPSLGQLRRIAARGR